MASELSDEALHALSHTYADGVRTLHGDLASECLDLRLRLREREAEVERLQERDCGTDDDVCLKPGEGFCHACEYASRKEAEVRELRRKLIRPQMLARQQADFDRYVYRIDTLEGIVRELREALRPFRSCTGTLPGRYYKDPRGHPNCGKCNGCRARQLVERHGGSDGG